MVCIGAANARAVTKDYKNNGRERKITISSVFIDKHNNSDIYINCLMSWQILHSLE